MLKRTRRAWPAIAIGLLMGTWLAVGIIALGSGTDEKEPPPRAPGLRGSVLPEQLTSRPVAPFRLRDARGGTLDTRDLIGRPVAVTFLFTRCPDVCPIIGQDLRAALEALGAASREVTVLAVSVDPRGDTPAAARRWLDRQRLPRNVRYLIGSRAALQPVWSRFYAAPQVPDRPETSTHTASVWLLDAAGRMRTKYSAGIPIPPADVAHDLRVLLDERNAG
jgi:protein SCO1/2